VQVGLLTVVFTLPGILLLREVLRSGPPPAEPSGRRLPNDEARELFQVLRQIARAHGVLAPEEVYLSALPEVSVLTVGGLFGLGARRVLVLGVPLVLLLSAAELRSLLVRELSRYGKHDTSFAGVPLFADALFRRYLHADAPPSAAERDPLVPPSAVAEQSRFWASRYVREVLGHLFAGFAHTYFFFMRSTTRSRLLASERASCVDVGHATARAALEKMALGASLYSRYVRDEVLRVAALGVVAEDLMSGFQLYRTRGAAPDAHRERTAPAASDGELSIAERLRTLDSLSQYERSPGDQGSDESASASSLFDDGAALNGVLTSLTCAFLKERVPGALKTMPWERIASTVLARKAASAALRVGKRIAPLCGEPTSSAAVFCGMASVLERGSSSDLVPLLSPELRHAVPEVRALRDADEIASALATVLRGALLEQGGEMDPSLGEPFVIVRFAGERVATAAIAARIMDAEQGPAELRSWIGRLEGVQQAVGERGSSAAGIDGLDGRQGA
jgi:hypothetical protein